MLKRKLVFFALIALVLTGFPTNILAAGLRGGYAGDADPVLLAPASADVYAELNRAGTLGDNFAALVRTYQAHPGTAAALNRLEASIGPDALRQFNTLLQAAPARVAVFATIPTNPSAQPLAAVIAQLKPASVMNGGNPLSGLATFSPSTSYRGTSIYRVTFTGGLGSGYGAVVSGDGVVAADVASVKSVIDAASFHSPSLFTDADFSKAAAQIGGTNTHTLTFYVSRNLLVRSVQASGSQGGATGIAGQTAATLSALRAYAVGITALPNGISTIMSASPRTGMLSLTPNNGVGVVGNNAISYVSVANVAQLLRSAGLLTNSTLAQARAQTGIDIARDVLPLVSREVVVDINDETSPLISTVVAAGVAGNSSSLGSVPQLPGSLELATEVSDQASAQASVNNILTSLTRAAGGSSSAPLLTKATLPDGSDGYVVAALPSIGYTFRKVGGHTFLVISSDLPDDVRAASAPLSVDADYRTALANAGGAASAASVSYTNVSRLLALVDKVLAYAQSRKAVSASDLATYRQDAEPLIAPFRNVAAVTRVLPSGDTQMQSFVTVR
jgi:hypothetical protein